MSNIKISAFADEYAESVDTQIQALKAFDINYIEVRHLNGKNVSALSLDEIKETKKKLNSFGINVSAVGSPLGKIKLDGDMDAHLETARRIFEYANILETEYVRVFSFYAPDGMNIADMKCEAVGALERLVVLARKYGVVLCHENEAKIYGDTSERCRELIDSFNGELKCVFDMGNFVLEGIDPCYAYNMLKDQIAYFHIKDALYEGAVVPAGKGDAKIKEVLRMHRQYSGNDFFVSLEPHLQTFAGLNALVGRSFKNPYQYEDAKTAFADAVEKFKELI